MKENKYKNISLSKLKELEGELEDKLEISKLKAYSIPIFSSISLVTASEITRNFTYNMVKYGAKLDKVQFNTALILATIGGFSLASSLVFTIPNYRKLKKDKKQLLEKKDELIKAYNKNKSILREANVGIKDNNIKHVINLDDKPKVKILKTSDPLDDYFKNNNI